MSGRIVYSLKRELTRNKAKSGVLGVMFLVACYFWMPMVWRWVSADPAPESQVVPQIPGENTAITQNSQAAPKKSKYKFRWRRVLQGISDDQLMQSATLETDQKDPFQKLVELPPQDVEQISQQHPQPVTDSTAKGEAASISAESLELVLESTFVGRKFRVAKINGVRYSEQATIVVESPERLELTLAEVHPQHVVLRSSESRFELQLERPDSLGASDIFQRPASRLYGGHRQQAQ